MCRASIRYVYSIRTYYGEMLLPSFNLGVGGSFIACVRRRVRTVTTSDKVNVCSHRRNQLGGHVESVFADCPAAVAKLGCTESSDGSELFYVHLRRALGHTKYVCVCACVRPCARVHLRALLPLALVILCRVALGALGDAPTVVQERSFGVGIAFQAAWGFALGVAVVLAARAIRSQLSGARAV